MSSLAYEWIGRIVVRAVWWRFQGQLKVAGGVFAVLVLLAGYVVARRVPPEG